MKRKLFFLLAATVLCSSAWAFKDTASGLYFRLRGTKATIIATKDAAYTGDIVIPKTVQYIRFDKKMRIITCTVDSIADYAFQSSTITSVKFDTLTNVEHIGRAAFSKCSSLKRVEIAEGVKSLGDVCFMQSSAVKYYDLPSTLEIIGNMAFGSAANCDTLICRATTPPTLGENAFIKDIPTFVPCQALDAYKAARGWSTLTYGDCFTHSIYWADADIADTTWYNTTDTEFELSTAAQLGGLARLVNEKTDNFKGKTIRLTADINLNKYCWMPISYFEAEAVNDVWNNLFAGTFDGQNHTIDYMNGLDQLTSKLGIGFFGVINEVTLKNIHLGANCTVENTTKSYKVGGLVGEIFGDEISAGHTASFIDYCSNAGSVKGNNAVGGLVGEVGSTTYITNCWNTGNVHGKNDNVGGIVGYEFNSHILNCYNRGSVGGHNNVGGIANHIEGGLIANNYNRALVGFDYMNEENGGCIIGSADDDGICAASNYYVSDDIDSGTSEFGTAQTNTWMTDGSMLKALNDSALVYNTANPTKPQLYNWIAGADSYPIIDRPTITGLEDAAANHLNIFAVNRQITILDAEGQNMQLFDVMGRIISQKTSIGNFETINVSNSGIYIVRIGNKTQKVVVK